MLLTWFRLAVTKLPAMKCSAESHPGSGNFHSWTDADFGTLTVGTFRNMTKRVTSNICLRIPSPKSDQFKAFTRTTAGRANSEETLYKVASKNLV